MKAMMSWSETLSLGDPEIDEQHRTLFALLNGLYNSLLDGSARQRQSLLFSDLTAYTRLHFQNEERYFEQFGYPELEAHARAHKELTDRLSVFRRRYEAGEADLTLELLRFLGDWIIGHVMQMDMRYRSFFAEVVRGHPAL